MSFYGRVVTRVREYSDNSYFGEDPEMIDNILNKILMDSCEWNYEMRPLEIEIFKIPELYNEMKKIQQRGNIAEYISYGETAEDKKEIFSYLFEEIQKLAKEKKEEVTVEWF